MTKQSHLKSRSKSYAKGKVIHWDDEKGFGFIANSKTKEEIFFHISAVVDKRRRPKLGCSVAYSLDKMNKKSSRSQSHKTSSKEWGNRSSTKSASKTSASSMSKKVVGADRAKHEEARADEVFVYRWMFYKHPAFKAWLFSVGYLALVTGLAINQLLPLALTPIYLLMSIIAFVFYYRDKAAAQSDISDRRRVPEATLHWLGLLFGWPGANIAQQWLRHKSQKKAFRWVFYLTVLVNIGAVAFLLHPKGAWINQILQDLLLNGYKALV